MSNPALFTERDAAGAYEILAAASDAPSVLAVLTDEELVALGGDHAVQMTGSPFLDQLEIADEVSASIALRSLIARGLVTLDDSQAEPEGEQLATGAPVAPRAVQLDRTLAGLMTLRGAPRALMNLTRRVSEQSTAITVYVFPERGLLEELVTADGYHHFSVPTRAAMPERLARYIDQAQVAGSEDRVVYEGPTAALEDPEEQIAQQLADTRALTVMTAADGGGAGVQVSLMATSEAVLAMDTPDTMGESTEARTVSAEGLIALIDAAIPRSRKPDPAEGLRSHPSARGGSHPGPVESPPVALTIGIVGLPNVGKSTLFNALTRAEVLAANYPFATIDPNIGMVPLPDPRLGGARHRVRQPEAAARDRVLRGHRRHRQGRQRG